MKLTIAIVLFLCVAQVHAQDKTEDQKELEKRAQEAAKKAGDDTSKGLGWKHTVATGLNINQVGFTDWVGGGENSLAFTIWLRGESVHNEEHSVWMNSYKLMFGETRIGGSGLRKTGDEIFFESLLIYKFGVYVNPYVSGSLRTQFAKGFAYDAAGNETPISKFFDPGYLIQSAGIAYKPVPEVTTRFGLAAREVITSEFTGYADDPATADIEKTKIEGGLESVTGIVWGFADHMSLTSTLAIFDPFKHLDRPIVRNDNVVTATVGEHVNTTFELDFINDVNVSPRTQMKELIAIGITYNLL